MKTGKYLMTVAAIMLLSLTRLSSQDKNSDFTPHHYFEVGAEYAFCLSNDWDGKVGGYFIYGKQRTTKYSQGFGIGLEYYRNKSNDFVVGIGDGNGNVNNKTFKDYRYNVPVFADFRFNLSQSKEPFYVNVRAGATFGFSDGDLEDGGLLFSAGLGKSFNAGSVSISPYVRADFASLIAGAAGSAAWVEPLIALGVNLRF